MGHGKVEKPKTHKRIVAIASKRFREEGLAGADSVRRSLRLLSRYLACATGS
jgi:hypothetical protein